jgi:tetratricopeptide (TPR) repeat protein
MNSNTFEQYFAFCDDQSWIWQMIEGTPSPKPIIKIPGNTSVRESWSRMHTSERIIIHWECESRKGGAIIEEILDIKRDYDVENKIIVITTDPRRDDVIYLGELGVKKILRVRHRQEEISQAQKQFQKFLSQNLPVSPIDNAWDKIQKTIETLTPQSEHALVSKVENSLEFMKQKIGSATARYFEIKGILANRLDQPLKAEEYWKRAINLNPNYFKAFDRLIHFYEKHQKHDAALSLLQVLHNKNNNRIDRFVRIGNVYKDKSDLNKAEHYYNEALNRDSYCSSALNGMAEIRFEQGNLEESKKLLSETTIAYKFAQKLNHKGIQMVKASQFESALEHYTKAQYVIPDQKKGPLIFFNIGLCYLKWGRVDMAREFLKIAICKEPHYKRARELLSKIPSQKMAA